MRHGSLGSARGGLGPPAESVRSRSWCAAAPPSRSGTGAGVDAGQLGCPSGQSSKGQGFHPVRATGEREDSIASVGGAPGTVAEDPRNLAVGLDAGGCEQAAGRAVAAASLACAGLTPVPRRERRRGPGSASAARRTGAWPGPSGLRARPRPLLLALDEAHQMGPGLARDVLNTVQELQSEGHPVLLILAGTPDLPRHLNAMGASFWDRSEKLPIGRLGPHDAAEAVRVPLVAAGRSITARCSGDSGAGEPRLPVLPAAVGQSAVGRLPESFRSDLGEGSRPLTGGLRIGAETVLRQTGMRSWRETGWRPWRLRYPGCFQARSGAGSNGCIG